MKQNNEDDTYSSREIAMTTLHAISRKTPTDIIMTLSCHFVKYRKFGTTSGKPNEAHLETGIGDVCVSSHDAEIFLANLFVEDEQTIFSLFDFCFR